MVYGLDAFSRRDLNSSDESNSGSVHGHARIDKTSDIADSMCKIHSTYDTADAGRVRKLVFRLESAKFAPSPISQSHLNARGRLR